MRAFLFVGYGLGCYLVFGVAFVVGVAFTGGWVPHRLLAAPAPPAAALLIDLALIALFGLQHSLMARAGFKRRWAEVVPGPLERSTYVLLASLTLLLIFWQWRSLPGVAWQVMHPAGAMFVWGLFALGWIIVIGSTFLIDHLDLTGLRQVWNHLRALPPARATLITPSLYRVVRHPMMLGFLITFWAVPVMTTGRLLFALGMTAYLLIGVSYEERDLLRTFGARYASYRRRVPMLIPWPRQRNLVDTRPSEGGETASQRS